MVAFVVGFLWRVGDGVSGVLGVFDPCGLFLIQVTLLCVRVCLGLLRYPLSMACISVEMMGS